MSDRVLYILCTKYYSARASIRAWQRLLRKCGLSDAEVADAMQYLVRINDYEYVVDTDRCLEIVEQVEEG